MEFNNQHLIKSKSLGSCYTIWVFLYLFALNSYLCVVNPTCYIYTYIGCECMYYTNLIFCGCSIVVVEWIWGKRFYNNWCCKGELCKFISSFFWLIFLILLVCGKLWRIKKIMSKCIGGKKIKSLELWMTTYV